MNLPFLQKNCEIWAKIVVLSNIIKFFMVLEFRRTCNSAQSLKERSALVLGQTLYYKWDTFTILRTKCLLGLIWCKKFSQNRIFNHFYKIKGVSRVRSGLMNRNNYGIKIKFCWPVAGCNGMSSILAEKFKKKCFWPKNAPFTNFFT